MKKSSKTRIKELENLIIKARNDYYNKSPTVSDQVYDAWIDELTMLKPDSSAITFIGAPPVSEWKKVAHNTPMGSLNKINTEEELNDWLNTINNENVLVTEKLDGISINLKYENGKFIQGITRGDGNIGEDITSNVIKMQGLAKTLLESFTGPIRGEIVLTKTDHQKYFPEYSSPRNAASGIAKRYDGTGSEHLTILCYKVSDGKDFKLESEQFAWLQQQGFIVPNWLVTDNPQKIWNKYQGGKRDSLNYDIDGLVITANDVALQLSLGEKDSRPKGSIAYKFAAITRESILRDIVWQVGGSGRITPVGIFDEVNILGAKITQACLHNVANINKLKLDIGAKILVARANDVIPFIDSTITPTKSIACAPDKCPNCGTKTRMDGEYLICPNTGGCSAQLIGRVKRYVNVLDVKEWGDGLVEKLVEAGLVKDIYDLYKLNIKDLSEIERMGEKSAKKVLETLWGKNPISLENLLGSLSIPLCGPTMIRLVMDAGHDTWNKIVKAEKKDFEVIAGFGPIKAEALYSWLHNGGKELVDNILGAGVKIKEIIMGTLTGMSFCFTGAMMHKRGELEELVKEAGGIVKSSVGKGLSYLVIADPNSTSGKAQAARKNGTKCISEVEFLKMVG